ncbi:CBS domain-containing protein [Rhodoferax sp.]|uniref:CBS domain-containing protein n=1 Tax=Rhodoferax sp. TaxID=50421 RepID=UPI0027478333|nr:CBS domain-containing protein [Rhodoferax sp.]
MTDKISSVHEESQVQPGQGPANTDPPTTLGSDHPVVAAAEAQAPAPAPVSSIEAVSRSRLVTVGADALLAEVAALLSSTQISLVVVCDAAGVAAGVITETILVRHLGYGKADVFTTRAGDVMVHAFTVCQPTDSLPDVLTEMHQRGLIHVPVVDQDKRPIGVVNARDGLRALLAQGNFEEALLRNYVMGIGYQ